MLEIGSPDVDCDDLQLAAKLKSGAADIPDIQMLRRGA
jgi:hypothetical protein